MFVEIEEIDLCWFWDWFSGSKVGEIDGNFEWGCDIVGVNVGDGVVEVDDEGDCFDIFMFLGEEFDGIYGVKIGEGRVLVVGVGVFVFDLDVVLLCWVLSWLM